MSSGARFIQNRKWLLGTLVFCLFEAVASWHGMDQPAPAKHDLTLLFGLGCTAVICTLIVVRTAFMGDRLVIGPIAVAAVLLTLINIILPNQQVVHILRALVSLMWAASFAAGVFILVSKPKEWIDGVPRA
jgi:hypothetical protein